AIGHIKHDARWTPRLWAGRHELFECGEHRLVTLDTGDKMTRFAQRIDHQLNMSRCVVLRARLTKEVNYAIFLSVMYNSNFHRGVLVKALRRVVARRLRDRKNETGEAPPRRAIAAASLPSLPRHSLLARLRRRPDVGSDF